MVDLEDDEDETGTLMDLWAGAVFPKTSMLTKGGQKQEQGHGQGHGQQQQGSFYGQGHKQKQQQLEDFCETCEKSPRKGYCWVKHPKKAPDWLQNKKRKFEDSAYTV